MQGATHTHQLQLNKSNQTEAKKQCGHKTYEIWTKDHCEIKMTHSTEYIPWVEEWHLASHFSVPPPKKHSYLDGSWLGHHQKNLWTELGRCPNCYSTENKTLQLVTVGQHACMLLCFQSHAFKFCTKLRVSVNIRVNEMFYWSSAWKNWHRWAFNQIKHLWGEKKQTSIDMKIYVHSSDHSFIIHPQK